jgi:hypothetical protein
MKSRASALLFLFEYVIISHREAFCFGAKIVMETHLLNSLYVHFFVCLRLTDRAN